MSFINNKLVLYAIIIALLLLLSKVWDTTLIIQWHNYKIITSIIFVLAIWLIVLLIANILKRFRRKFRQISDNTWAKNISLYLQLPKGNSVVDDFNNFIRSYLVKNYVKNTKDLHLLIKLDQYLIHNEFAKITTLEANKKYHDAIIKYFQAESYLKQNQTQKALNIYNLNIDKDPWAFIKLLLINFTDTSQINKYTDTLYEHLTSYQAIMSKTLYNYAKCLLEYQKIKNQDEIKLKDLDRLIAGYPNFIPAHSLAIQFLSDNESTKLENYLFKSWQVDVTYHNTFAISSFLDKKDQNSIYQNFIKMFCSHNKASDTILLAKCFLEFKQGTLLEAHNTLMQINNTNSTLYKLLQAYLLATEYKHSNPEKIHVYTVIPTNSVYWWEELFPIKTF